MSHSPLPAGEIIKSFADFYVSKNFPNYPKVARFFSEKPDKISHVQQLLSERGYDSFKALKNGDYCLVLFPEENRELVARIECKLPYVDYKAYHADVDFPVSIFYDDDELQVSISENIGWDMRFLGARKIKPAIKQLIHKYAGEDYLIWDPAPENFRYSFNEAGEEVVRLSDRNAIVPFNCKDEVYCYCEVTKKNVTFADKFKERSLMYNILSPEEVELVLNRDKEKTKVKSYVVSNPAFIEQWKFLSRYVCDVESRAISIV